METSEKVSENIEEEFEEKKINLVRDVSEIIYLLICGSNKFSKKLGLSNSIISELVRLLEKRESEREKDDVKKIENDEDSTSVVESSESEFKGSDLSKNLRSLKETFDKMSSEFKGFSEKLEELVKDLRKDEDLKNLDRRVPLPTHVRGVRMSSDSFIKILKHYPVPHSSLRETEIKMRRRLIMSHSENISAVMFLSELRELPFDYELEKVISSSKERVENTKRLLMKEVEQLSEFHESYVDFLKEYVISLDSEADPQHESKEYRKELIQMISKARATDLGRKQKESEERKVNKYMEDLQGLVEGFKGGMSKEPKDKDLTTIIVKNHYV